MWGEKAMRWGWGILVLNAMVSIMNIGFGYGHLTKHEYWAAGLSWALVLMNGWVAWGQYKSIRQWRQEIKELMWKTLSTPSEALR